MALTDKEREKMWAETFARIDGVRKDVYINGNWGNSPLPPPPVSTWSPSATNPSPTDKESIGKFPYQGPEVDEQGTYYGYKILLRGDDADVCDCEHCQALVSPRYSAIGIWVDGELEASQEPSRGTMYGIHCTKRPDHPALVEYMGDRYYYRYDRGVKSILVRCALSGTIIETEQGFRAQHAQIMEVYLDGNWTSYQNYQKCSRAYTRRTSYRYSPPEDWNRDFRTTNMP